MSNTLPTPDRLERLLDAARWLRLAGDLDGSFRLLEQASALAPTDTRVTSMLGTWKVPAKGETAKVEPALAPRKQARPVPGLLRRAAGIEVGQRLAAAARAWVQGASSKPSSSGADLGIAQAPPCIGPPEWAEPTNAGSRWESGADGAPAEPLELCWDVPPPRVATQRPPVADPTPAPAPKPVAEVTVLRVAEGAALAAPVVLRFHEGPLAGQRVELSHETVYLGEPGHSPALEVRDGVLRVRAHSVGDDAAVYVALRGETRIGSPTVFRAGNTRFLYERRRDELGGGELYFLHTLGTRRQIARTHLIREAVLTVGREGCDLELRTDPALEPRHFELTPGPWVTFLEDHSSAESGTFLEQTAGITGPLSVGDRVYAGGHAFSVEVAPTASRKVEA